MEVEGRSTDPSKAPMQAWWPDRRRALIALAGAGLAACGKPPPAARRVPAGARVLALGDSLTYGTGAEPGAAYPAVLAALTGWDVRNAGVPGDTSVQALQRLPDLLLEHEPALVIVSIGGNDFLRRQPEDQTAAHIRRICETARAAGAQVLLVAVPRPSIAARLTGSLDDHPIYAALAQELGLPLHAGGWAGVLADPALRSDAIHANAAGYRRFANGLHAGARAAGLL